MFKYFARIFDGKHTYSIYKITWTRVVILVVTSDARQAFKTLLKLLAYYFSYCHNDNSYYMKVFIVYLACVLVVF
jgi:hypothetical protein